MTNKNPRIIIIGAGFGGLFAAREFAKKPVEVLLVDRNNYHTFTPLLYQVATCALNPSEIAYPIRNIFRNRKNVNFMLGTVTAVDQQTRNVHINTGAGLRHEPYDYLILATGSTPTYFGNDNFRQYSFELRTLSDALKLRNHVLRMFEKAAWSDDDT